MSRKANQKTTIDLSKIPKLYYKLQKKYSQYSLKQLDTLEKQLQKRMAQDSNYYKNKVPRF